MKLIILLIEDSQSLSKTKCFNITNDFTTGNFSRTSSRYFDFPIHTIPNSADMTFGINEKDFTDVEYLSSGSNVVVYTGIRKQEFIVVKMLKAKIQNRTVAVEELNLEMQILTKVDHENIIRIIGAGEQPRKFIILEYLGGGTLDKVLDEMKTWEKRTMLPVQKSIHLSLPLMMSLRWQTALPIAVQLASVLKYLHDDFHPRAAIIHRGMYVRTYLLNESYYNNDHNNDHDSNIDLKPENIGFTADGQLKLFDFGLAACVVKQQLASDTYEMTGFTGTLVYMAPEVYLKQPYNEKVDVYSFAMILWEIISGEKVFSKMSREEHMQEVVLCGQRPSLSPIRARAPEGVARLLGRCWHPDHQLRPDFATIQRELMAISGEEENTTAASTPSHHGYPYGTAAVPTPVVVPVPVVAATAASSVHVVVAGPKRRSRVDTASRSSWTTAISGNSSRSSNSNSNSTVHVDRGNTTSIIDQNQVAASMMKVVTKPAPKKKGFLGSCLSLKL